METPVRGSGLFDEPTVRRHRFDVTFTADEHALNLSTRSTTKMLPQEGRPRSSTGSEHASCNEAER
jgi:hypothetical protein